MVKTKQMVLTVLENVQESRNSDITLMIEIWKRYYPQVIRKGKEGELGVYLKDLYSLPREDHVKRIRAHIQNDLNKFLPTDPIVVRERRINEERWREYMSVNHL
jgi:hypothetical protein